MYAGWKPFITHINAGTVDDCKAYVDKLASFGAAYSPGKLIISANANGYSNTNYVMDGVRLGYGYADNYALAGGIVSSATNGLLANGVSSSAIIFADGLDNVTNNAFYNGPHITNAVNVAGYMCWGYHSSLGTFYALSNNVVWTGNSDWWLIQTSESFNGQREANTWQCGNYINWFSINAFGGSGYSKTPVGAASYVDDPVGETTDPSLYFGLWAGGKTFAITVWNSRHTEYFQALGDPFKRR